MEEFEEWFPHSFIEEYLVPGGSYYNAEAWFTFSDPNDPGKKEADDQLGLSENLEQGCGYYIARCIISDGVQSPVSNCIYVELGLIENNPTRAPDVDGQVSGKAGKEYEYSFISTDPTEDDVYYWVIWDDGNIEEWVGPYDSNEEVTFSHTWSKQGMYTIRAKAKDTFDAESDWATFEISMPRNKPFTPLLPRLLEWLMMRFPILEQIFQYLIT